MNPIRTSLLFALALCLSACGDKEEPDDTSDTPEADTDTDTDTDADTDADADADADADTDADTDADYPAETGFEFDGAWYPLSEAGMFCQSQAGLYIFSSGALRDGSGEQGNGYADFHDVPEPGSYRVVAFDGFTAPAPDAVGVWVLDFRDSSFWYSDGVSGTLDVYESDGALDVVWHGVSLLGAAGTITSEEGWLRCTP
jgi:hypothetical protein